MKKNKVLMIDPWGTDYSAEYTNGLCRGLGNITDLTLITNYYYQDLAEANFTTFKCFFKISENMKRSYFRKLIRGIEYIICYHRILQLVKNNEFEVIHFQWLLMYNFDVPMLKKIKTHTNKLILTAHNVFPHISGESYIPVLNKLYNIFDRIILHGENIELEFNKYFFHFREKVYLQKFGFILEKKYQIRESSIQKNIKNISKNIKNYDKTFIIFGNQFYNKGTDRIVEIFEKNKNELKNIFLIIAGKNSEKYLDLHKFDDYIKNADNIVMINEFLPKDDLDFLIEISDLILLPYRHASMSAVVFTAAQHSKSVFLTKTGALEEYIIDGENAFLVNNDNVSIEEKLMNIANIVSKEELKIMGDKLKYHISTSNNWNLIADDLYCNCYNFSGKG